MVLKELTKYRYTCTWEVWNSNSSVWSCYVNEGFYFELFQDVTAVLTCKLVILLVEIVH